MAHHPEPKDSNEPIQKPPRAMHKIILPILMGGAAIFGLAYSTFLAGQYISGENIPITKEITPTPTNIVTPVAQ
jgi:hypothetical protein